MTEIIHYDQIKTEIKIGSIVVYGRYNHLVIGKVIKLTKKMVKIIPIEKLPYHQYKFKYPEDVIVLPDSAELNLFIVTHT